MTASPQEPPNGWSASDSLAVRLDWAISPERRRWLETHVEAAAAALGRAMEDPTDVGFDRAIWLADKHLRRVTLELLRVGMAPARQVG